MQPNHESAINSISRSQEHDATFQFKVNPHNHVVKITRKPLKHQSHTPLYKTKCECPIGWILSQTVQRSFQSTYRLSNVLLSNFRRSTSGTLFHLHFVRLYVITFESESCSIVCKLEHWKSIGSIGNSVKQRATSFLFVLTSEKATTNQNYCLWSKNKVVIFVKYSANKF